MLGLLRLVFHKAALSFTASLIAVSGALHPVSLSLAPEKVVVEKADVIEDHSAPNSALGIDSSLVSSVISGLGAYADIELLIPEGDGEQRQKDFSSRSSFRSTITAGQLLERTKPVLKQRIDGTYWLELHSNLSGVLGNAFADFKWDPGQTKVGSGSPIPQFDVSTDCNPSYDETPSSISSPISFRIRTSYVCDLKLSLGGRSVGQREFSFVTGPGLLLFSQVHGLSTYLKSDVSTNGVVLTNTDDNPVSVTNLAFDISAEAISTDQPAAVRFSDYNGNILGKYFLADTIKDPINPYSYAKSGVEVPVSVAVGGHATKLIYVEAINIQTLLIGPNPTISLSFRKPTIDRSDMTILSLPNPVLVSWSCVAKYSPEEQNEMCH